MKTDDHVKRWILPKPISEENLVSCNLDPILQKVLLRRGIDIHNDLNEYLIPSELPNPEVHFNQLSKATHRIIRACKGNEKIAICGDYDADGITSTVLLVELLSLLGAKVEAYIPSRQDEGYGLNLNMINDINSKDIKLIITVDNGISAFDSIKRSNELGIDLIITDHHKIPENKLDFFALIHPERTPCNSPYRFLAGVGIAYMLAKNICNKLNYNLDLTAANELFCIGTVADMAPLIGANRYWLKELLPKFTRTKNIGIRSILKKLSIENTEISTNDIGYKIAPLINAVGRIGDPILIINLLINSSESSIDKLTKEIFAISKERKKITVKIVDEAMKEAISEYANNRKFLVLTNRKWHAGIIGIVAARIVDKFNLPTAVLSMANNGIFRGSIRSNNQLKVNLALDKCKDILINYGGHSNAAGFTIKEENLFKLKEMLNNIANSEFNNCCLDKFISPDAYLCFKEINYDFYNQLKLIGPFGIMNRAPIFWTRKCRIIDLQKLKGNHCKMTLNDGTAFIDAIKWNCSANIKINDLIDIAFYVELNQWKKSITLQVNIIDIKKYNNVINLQLHNNIYKCELRKDMKVQITNSHGEKHSSDFSSLSHSQIEHKDLFIKKILSYAEIALGKTA